MRLPGMSPKPLGLLYASRLTLARARALASLTRAPPEEPLQDHPRLVDEAAP